MRVSPAEQPVSGAQPPSKPQASWGLRLLKWGLLAYGVAVLCLCGLCVLPLMPRFGFDQREVQFTVSPDGKYIAFVGGPRSAQVYLLNLETRTVQRVSPEGTEAIMPSFSPDGKQLLYSARPARDKSSAPYTLYLYSLDRQSTRPLLALPQHSVWGIFLPDGKHLLVSKAEFQQDFTWGPLFALTGAGTWRDRGYLVVHVDGTIRHTVSLPHIHYSRSPTARQQWLLSEKAYRIEDILRGVSSPRTRSLPVPAIDYHPSGKYIYIHAPPRSYEYDLWLYDEPTKRKERLTFIKGYIGDAQFHPDGRRAFFLKGDWSQRDPRYTLMEVDFRTKQTREIADPSLFDNPLRWRAP
ncbi:MAG: hypothetical protein N2651_02790 [Fimbriimonadales bacterium]|nr:hypothetical protein [Fimbriimonadales bacterium]